MRLASLFALAAVGTSVIVMACVADTATGLQCPLDKKACGGACVAKDDPQNGCAAESCNPCAAVTNGTATCTSGACASTCSAGFDDCDADPKNGCEANLGASAKTCGACNNSCGAQNSSSPPRCEAGKCVFTCSPNFAHCGGADSGGCETNLQTSGTNCGACGRSCEGGTCTAGKCDPFLLTSAVSPKGITVDATNVYYTLTSSNAVMRIGKDGKCVPASPCPQVVASGIDPNIRGPGAIAVDTKNIYWTAAAGAKIGYVPTTGGTVNGFNGVTSPEPGGLALDGGKVFFVGGFGTNRLIRANLDGTAITVMSTNANAGRGNVATDGTFVYWTNDAGSIYRAGFNDAACAETSTCKVVAGGASSVGIAVDATNVYFTSPTSNTVIRAPKGGGLTAPIAGGQDGPTPVVVDATFVYWGNVGPGAVGASIRRAPIAAGVCAGPACEVFVKNVTPTALALDAKALYFVDSAVNGGVYRVVR